MKIYVIGDIHGYIGEFNEALQMVRLEEKDTKLILLGDYVHGHDSYAVLDRVMELEEQYGSDRVIALMGNHEASVLSKLSKISEYDDVRREVKDDSKYIAWMKKLPKYYEEGNRIFVHAGIDEEAQECWAWGTPSYMFYEKYPPTTGPFYMDIIAGHIGTCTISGDENFHGVYHDGQAHYYVNGSVQVSKHIPVLLIDADENRYYEVTPEGNKKLALSDGQ